MSGTLVPRSITVASDIPLVEVPVPSPNDEARAAFGLVDYLLGFGVSKRDVLVVASNLRDYEPALARAAIRLEHTPTFWTQLDLENTRLYRLLRHTCELLEAGRLIAAKDLQSVLAMGWTPPHRNEDDWPVTQMGAVSAFEGVAPSTKQSLPDWRRQFSSPEDDGRVLTLIDWLDQNHPADPATVEGVLYGLVGRYRKYVLPTVKANDDPALLDTETAARATVRMETLVGQVGAKYRSRLNDSRISASWSNVAGLIESVASQAPGRREHANGRAIDVMEPNDVWPRKAKYVIVIGLVKGEWPSPTDSLVPAEIRAAINAEHESTNQIVPRPAWSGGRAIDQFAEVLDAATEGVLLLRHSRTVEGEEVLPSSLLDLVPTSTVDKPTRDHLLRETLVEPAEVLGSLGLADSINGDQE